MLGDSVSPPNRNSVPGFFSLVSRTSVANRARPPRGVFGSMGAIWYTSLTWMKPMLRSLPATARPSQQAAQKASRRRIRRAGKILSLMSSLRNA